MRGNSHVRFLEGGGLTTARLYSTNLLRRVLQTRFEEVTFRLRTGVRLSVPEAVPSCTTVSADESRIAQMKEMAGIEPSPPRFARGGGEPEQDW
jgi:hypothetical protein